MLDLEQMTGVLGTCFKFLYETRDGSVDEESKGGDLKG